MPTPARPRCLVLFSLAATLALAASCSSPPEPEHAAQPTVTADLPPIMAGTENFAGGKIIVKVTLAMPGNYHAGKEGGLPGGGQGGSSRHSGSGGGRHHGGDQAGADAPPSGDSSDDGYRPSLTGSTLPPAQIKLYLQNTSVTEDVKCEVVDFNSTLGNFAVFPSRYQIEAGQSATSEVMTSRLGVEGGEIPIMVALRIGDHTESKVVTLRLLNPPPEAAK
jgi:hypothetical protein